MYLGYQLDSLWDEHTFATTFSDSSFRTSQYRIELNRTSYGSLGSGFDTVDYFQIRPGVGSFHLIVTSDAANGFTPAALSSAFDVEITNSTGQRILGSVVYDQLTRTISFTSSSDEIYYVEVSRSGFGGSAFAYAATMWTAGAGGDGGSNFVFGDAAANAINGGAGADRISGLGGADTILAGAGHDDIYGDDGDDYLRGEDGDDLIYGGAGFDDTHGNVGNDSVSGEGGPDWVVGGKGDDRLWGDADHDVVYGNIGNDTASGGDGNDVVRGGQNDDIVYGDAGDDYVSGDRGDDTVTGGSGADLFHTFGDAGIDRVLDFNRAEGDRVMLDPGTTYTFAQVGADVVITMGGGGQMILVGVQVGNLVGDWVFGS